MVGPVFGAASRTMAAGVALEALILADHLGWAGWMIGQRLHVSPSEANHLVRTYRDHWASTAARIAERLIV